MRTTAKIAWIPALALSFWLGGGWSATRAAEPSAPSPARLERLRAELRTYPHKLVRETFRGGNWELVLSNADGSGEVNLTRTPKADELYPHASPDGRRLVFVADQGAGDARIRNVYLMNLDGSGRVRLGENGRQPFWSPDGNRIGFVRGTHVEYGEGGGANKELYFYDVKTRRIRRHPNPTIAGLLNPCCTPDGKWVVASVMGGMQFNHSIVAFEANGPRVVELARSCVEAPDVYQCRPDVSADGKRVAWGKEDCDDFMWVEVGDLVYSGSGPKVVNRRRVATVKFPLQIYHVDWSPDGRYLAYAVGGRGTKMQPAGYVVGTKAKGWDIWVVKPSEPEVAVQITHDGLSNKEPDWVFAGAGN